MRDTKFDALYKVNNKINQIQDLLQVKMNSEEGFAFNFDIPNSESDWIDSHELGEDTLYKRIKLFNYNDEKINMIIFYGKKDSHVKKHNHEQPHILVCIEGYLNITVDDKIFTLKKGQSIYVDSFQWHSIDFIEASKLIIIYV